MYEKVEYEPSEIIIDRIEQIETEIQSEMAELKKLLEVEQNVRGSKVRFVWGRRKREICVTVISLHLQ